MTDVLLQAPAAQVIAAGATVEAGAVPLVPASQTMSMDAERSLALDIPV